MNSLTTRARIWGKLMAAAAAPLSLAVLIAGCEPTSATREKERVENAAEQEKENIDRRLDAHENRAEDRKDEIDRSVEAQKDQIEAQQENRGDQVPPPETP